jgi:hypothetical protein
VPETWKGAWGEGREMTTEQAVEYALKGGGGATHDTAGA